jgi:hypothetical protein
MLLEMNRARTVGLTETADRRDPNLVSAEFLASIAPTLFSAHGDDQTITFIPERDLLECPYEVFEPFVRTDTPKKENRLF